TLVNNMVVGVTQGFEKVLVMEGVGYRAQVAGKQLTLNVGYSHPITFDAPENISFETPQPTRIVIKASTNSRLARLPRISAASVSRSLTWARVFVMKTSVSAARKARPVRNKKGSERECFPSGIVMRF